MIIGRWGLNGRGSADARSRSRDRIIENGSGGRGRLRASLGGALLSLAECGFASNYGRQRVPDIPRLPQLRREDSPERSAELAQSLRPGRLAGRRFAMAPDLRVDLYRHRTFLPGLSDGHRNGGVEAGTVFLAGVDSGWLPLGPHLAFCGDVGDSVLPSGASRNGRAARLE